MRRNGEWGKQSLHCRCELIRTTWHGRLKKALQCARSSSSPFLRFPVSRSNFLTLHAWHSFQKSVGTSIIEIGLKKIQQKKEEYMSSKITSLFFHILALGLILVGALIGYIVFIPMGVVLELVFWILLFNRKRKSGIHSSSLKT